MEIIVWIILIFTLLQLLVAFTNLLFQPNYSSESLQSDLISVLIPARNEENNIGNLLSDLQQQSYSNIEVLVFNDQSADQTQTIVTDFVKNDQRFQIINSDSLPNGWLGKNYACYVLGNRATGSYYLFLDADVRIGKNLILQTVNYLKKHQLSLLSIFPKQQMKTFGEFITVPNMNYILLTMLPLILVEKTNIPSLSAANGQLMLFNSKIYKEIQPHEKLKLSKVEDIETARLFKRNGLKVACHTGNKEISCRMYNSYNEAVNGFSKNVIMFFGNSTLLAILFWLITTLGFIIILIEKSMVFNFGFVFVLFLTRMLVAIKSRQNVFFNILLFPLQQITLAIFIYKSAVHHHQKNYEWKGRKIT
ncbi:MAG: glycosyltransferase family 2 protein [Draconibacterium sp.]